MNNLLLTLTLISFASVSLADAWAEMPWEIDNPCDDESTIALACDFDSFFTCKKCWTSPCSDYVCETKCQDFSCSDMEECVNTNCVGCETEFLDYGNCNVYKDCGVDCRQECARVADDAIEVCEADQVQSETCVNCILVGMPNPEDMRCDGFDCDLISQCLVDESCDACKAEYQDGFDCLTKEYCGFTCFSSTRRLEQSVKHSSYKGFGLLRHVRKLESGHKRLVEAFANTMGSSH